MSHSKSLIDKPEAIYPFIVICLMTLLASHPLQGLLGVDVKYVFVPVITSLFFVGLYLVSGRLSQSTIVVISIVLLSTSLGSIVSGSIHQLSIGLVGAFIFTTAITTYSLISLQVSIAILTWVNIIILIGAWIGFGYAFIGGGPILDVPNLETERSLLLYLTTFTNSVAFGVIRPSGIFDEPGALAMYTIIVVCLNELTERDRLYSKLLLVMNLITFSLMAIAALILYIIFILGRRFAVRAFLMAAVVFLMGSIEYLIGGNFIQELVLNRFEIEGGQLAGDNRSRQVDDFFYIIDGDLILKGQTTTGHIYSTADQSSNPFSIMYESGIFVWLLYVLALVWLIMTGFKYTGAVRFSAITMTILLLQRPYIFSLYWGLPISYVLVSISQAQYLMHTRSR